MHKGQDKEIFERKIINIFYLSIQICVLGAQKNLLIETALLSTHNICFVEKLDKYFSVTHSYLGAWCISLWFTLFDLMIALFNHLNPHFQYNPITMHQQQYEPA